MAVKLTASSTFESNQSYTPVQPADPNQALTPGQTPNPEQVSSPVQPVNPEQATNPTVTIQQKRQLILNQRLIQNKPHVKTFT